MKFVVATKPLKSATALGIIKANISKFYNRSGIVQITATRDALKINIQASGIKTRITLSGSGDSDVAESIIVDCSVFKNLIDSIESEVIAIEFVPGGISIHADTSKFAISQMIDVADMRLEEPMEPTNAEASVTVKPSDWQFVKDHQMYAIATKDTHPVYMNAWVGADGDVIVGDFDLSMFTYSKRGAFGNTCLFPTALINLFSSIPEGSTVSKIGKNYILSIISESYSIITEITPKYEDDEAVGSYNSKIILDMLVHPESYVTIEAGAITRFINQTSIISKAELDKVFDFTVQGNELTLANATSSYSMTIESTSENKFTVKFNSDLFKSVLSNFDSETINVAPMVRNGTAIGCIFWTDNLTTLLAGVG